jgi:hypothetical protein
MKHMSLVYGTVAEWVPMRLDDLETEIILSRVTYFLLKFWETE